MNFQLLPLLTLTLLVSQVCSQDRPQRPGDRGGVGGPNVEPTRETIRDRLRPGDRGDSGPGESTREPIGDRGDSGPGESTREPIGDRGDSGPGESTREPIGDRRDESTREPIDDRCERPGDRGDESTREPIDDRRERPDRDRDGEDGSGEQRPRLPGVNEDGSFDLDRMTEGSFRELLMDNETFDGEEMRDVCNRMFDMCAGMDLFMELRRRLDMRCFRYDVTDIAMRVIAMRGVERLRESRCPEQWRNMNIRRVCNESFSGREYQEYLTCLGDAQRPEDMRDLSRDDYLDNLRAGNINPSTDSASDREEGRELIRDQFGDDPSQYSSEEIEALALSGQGAVLQTSELRQMDMRNLSASARAQLYRGRGMEATEAVSDALRNGNTPVDQLTGDDLDGVIGAVAGNPALVREMNANAVREAVLDDIDEISGDCSELSAVMRRMEEATDYDASDFLGNRDMARCMSTNDLSGLDASSIQSAIEENRDTFTGIRRNAGRAIADTLVEDIGDLSSMSEEDFDNSGLAAVLGSARDSVLEEMNVAVIQSRCRNMSSSLNTRRSSCQTVKQRLLDEGSTICDLVQMNLTRCIECREIQDAGCTPETLGLMGDDLDGENFNNPRLARCLMQLYQSENGDPSDDSTDEFYSDERISRLGCIFAQGASDGMLSDFEDDRVSTVTEVAQSCQLDNSQREAITERVTDMDRAPTEDEQEQIGAFGSGRPIDELDAAERCDACRARYESMGEQSVTTTTRAELESQTTAALQCSCENEVVEDRSESGTISEDTVSHLGNLVCGMSADQMSRVDVDGMRSVMDQMPDCAETVTGEVRQAIADRFDELTDGEDIDEADCVRLTPVMDEYGTERISDEVMETCSTSGLSVVNTITENSQEREASGMPTEADSEAMGNTAQRMITGLRGDSARRRRKRTTGDISCSDVTVAGSASRYFTASQLASISDFTDCAGTLGEIQYWDSEQLDELVILSKVAYGNDVSSWTDDEVMTVGSIMAGLAVSEMGDIAVFDNDVMSVIGAYNLYSVTQLEAGFTAYMSNMGYSGGADLSATDLTSLGEFACGAPDSIIANIPVDEYMSAASAVGELMLCDEDRMMGYADLAMDSEAFDNVQGWSAVDMATIGNMIGGITATDIATLTMTQIEAISTIAISLVPADTLAALSVTQIGYLSSAQAEAVTEEQQEEFTNAQLDALEAAGGTIEVDDNGGNGAGTLSVALVTMAVPLFPTML